jgi:glycosyltransferase involved in cell wall biosynthesis
MKKIFFVATVEYAVKSFLIKHISELSNHFDLTVITNVHLESDLFKQNFFRLVPLKIQRKVDFFADLKVLIYLIYYFIKFKPYAVHSITPKAGLLAMVASFLTRIPVRVHTFTGQVWAIDSGSKRWILKYLDRLVAYLATNVIVDSPSQQKFLLDEKVLTRDKSIVFGSGSVSGVDLTRFRQSKQLFSVVRRELMIPQDAFVFTFLGRLNKDKGILDLAHAFSFIEHKNAFLLLVGPDEGVFVNEIKNINEDKLDKIRFVGLTSEPERYLAASNALCLPSHREGFGSVIIEAAAMRVPAIASNIYGISDAIVNNETGILHKAHDVEAIRDAMTMFLSDIQLSIKYGEAAKSRAIKFFDSKIVSRHWLNFYLDRFVQAD